MPIIHEGLCVESASKEGIDSYCRQWHLPNSFDWNCPPFIIFALSDLKNRANKNARLDDAFPET
jgi:hypothetical protein